LTGVGCQHPLARGERDVHRLIINLDIELSINVFYWDLCNNIL